MLKQRLSPADEAEMTDNQYEEYERHLDQFAKYPLETEDLKKALEAYTSGRIDAFHYFELVRHILSGK